jgi:hypothetical protein
MSFRFAFWNSFFPARLAGMARTMAKADRKIH